MATIRTNNWTLLQAACYRQGSGSRVTDVISCERIGINAGAARRDRRKMEVIVYTRPDCEDSRRIKELLAEKGVKFQEPVCADGMLDGMELCGLEIDVMDVPLTVVDGVPIAALQRSRIEQANCWSRFYC